MKTYILQKDLPTAKKGDPFIEQEDKVNYFHYDTDGKVNDVTHVKIIESNPDWFKLKEEKLYEIIDFSCPDGNISTDASWLKDSNMKIHRVKRISDGEVFTLGDVVYRKWGTKPIVVYRKWGTKPIQLWEGRISEFSVNLSLNDIGVYIKEWNSFAMMLSKIEKLPKEATGSPIRSDEHELQLKRKDMVIESLTKELSVLTKELSVFYESRQEFKKKEEEQALKVKKNEEIAEMLVRRNINLYEARRDAIKMINDRDEAIEKLELILKEKDRVIKSLKDQIEEWKKDYERIRVSRDKWEREATKLFNENYMLKERQMGWSDLEIEYLQRDKSLLESEINFYRDQLFNDLKGK